MKKVKRLLAVVLVVLTVLSISAFPASATTTLIAQNQTLSKTTSIVFRVNSNELFFKLYYNNTGTASITPKFIPVNSGTLSVPSNTLTSGTQRLYYRQSTKAQEVVIQFVVPSGTVMGTYSLRRASTLSECGKW